MYGRQHIGPNDMGMQQVSMASGSTKDGTQHKRLNGQVLPFAYIVTQRPVNNPEGEVDVIVTKDIAEAIKAYNDLG